MNSPILSSTIEYHFFRRSSFCTANTNHRIAVIPVVITLNHSERDTYTIVKTTSTHPVMRLVATAGLSSLKMDGSKAMINVTVPSDNAISCHCIPLCYIVCRSKATYYLPLPWFTIFISAIIATKGAKR